MSSSVRELRVWQEAVATAGEIARLARKSGRPETRTLVDLLVRCSAEVALAVARAHVKDTPPVQRDAFRTARDAAAALETGLAIARHAELFPLPACADLGAKAGNVSRLVAGYLAYLDRLIEADAEAAKLTMGTAAASPR